MDKKVEQFAIGYLRVPDLTDDKDVHEKISFMQEYCRENGISLPVVFTEPMQGSDNFKGPAWRDIENTLVHAEGRINAVVVLYSNMLTRDLSLQLVKERALKEKFGVTIDFADGYRKLLDQNKNLSLN